jgi:RNA polymerase sigma-70 factor (ECF subfamily)
MASLAFGVMGKNVQSEAGLVALSGVEMPRRTAGRTVAELTGAIASGDADAFARLFRERFAEMLAEARRATRRDESFCLDVVQDAFVRVIRSMRRMRSNEHLAAWLRVVVQSCAYDRLREESRRRRREAQAVEVRDAGADDLAERIDWLRRELHSMDASHARLLVLRYRLGWTLERIGDALGLTTGAVDGRLRRITATLRRRAMEDFNE